MTTFTDLGVPADLDEVLTRRGITDPFPIQGATLADAFAGRDVCGRAPTGSGKTLAYGLPLVARCRKGRPRRPAALVLLPTRELAAQVADELRPLAAVRGRSVATFYGGTTIARDQRRLRSGVDIAVACPGRLADLVRRHDVDLQDVRVVVVDEADRMADMGFLPEVRRLLDTTSAERQTLLFSATLDGDVDVLVRRYQHDPVRREVADAVGEQGVVRHFFWHAQAHDRVGLARDIIRTVSPAIVFTRTKHGADRLSKQLNKRGIGAAAIHGNRSQNQRERALTDFADGRVKALVATDIAARGIHVDRVGAVVHYDPPATDKDYVHRSGRTGRAGSDGVVVTLVLPDKVRDVTTLQRALSMQQAVGDSAVSALGDATRGGDVLVPAGATGSVGAQAGDAPVEPSGRQPGTGRGQAPRKGSPARNRSGKQRGGGRNARGGGRHHRADRQRTGNGGRAAGGR